MGSHRARHRSDRNPSEELATDLLARLAAEARPRTSHRREATPGSLDPFSTAPFPARPSQPTALTRPARAPRPGNPGVLLSATGATRCGGTATHHRHPLLGDRVGTDTERAAAGRVDTVDVADHDGDAAGHDGDARAVTFDTFDAETDTSTRADAGLFAPSLDTRRPDVAHSVIAGLDGPALPPVAPFSLAGTVRGLRSRPLYAAVSATVITATAAVAASAGPAAFTPASATTPDLTARSAASASGAAADFALPGGPAAAPTTSPSAAAAPVQGATLAAQATSDAKAHGQGPTTATASPSAPPSSAPASTATTTAPSAPTTAPTTVHATPPPTTSPSAPPQATTTAPAPSRPAPRPAPAPVRATPAPAARPAPAAVGSNVGSRALSMARGKLGAPYVWGSAGPSAFDCSGLVVWAFRQLGVSLPHSSSALSTMGAPVSQSALQPGDLVFFYSPVSHVGIYAGNGMVINATQSGQPVQYTKLAYLPFHNARRITG